MSFQGDSSGDDAPIGDGTQRAAPVDGELLDSHGTEPKAGTVRRRPWIVGGASLAVLVAAGAGFAVGSMIGGGGAQPEDVLPSTVVMYADLDLDPAASQKLNLVRLLGRFPEVEDDYGPEPDVRELLVEQLTEDSDLASDDVLEWAGDRVGAGVAWDDEVDALTPVVAIQVSDESAALDDLRDVVPADQVAAADGYVVVTGDASDFAEQAGGTGGGQPLLSSQSAAEIVAAGEQESLADAAGFSGAFDHLDEGLATVYIDGDAVAAAGDEVATLLGLDNAQVGDPFGELGRSGQMAAVLRAEPDAIEVAGWMSGESPYGSAPVTLVNELPQSTLFALEFTGGAESFAEQWDALKEGVDNDMPAGSFERSLAQIEAQYGVRLPDDVVTLLGDDLVLAVDGDGLLTGVPGIGARSLTDPAEGADLARRLQRTLATWSGGFGLTAEGTDDGMVIASTPEFADVLTGGGGDLGTKAAFQEAVPDADGASVVMWFDFSAVASLLALAEPESAALIDPLDSLGVSVTSSDSGSTMRARLVFTDS
ncbi:MAG TPA: hypothetical protein VFX15_02480 [Actinomycetes bacterium]|nr:hypothetical protein [Actinomycetes bacterium]